MSYHLIEKPLGTVSEAETIAALGESGCVLLRDPAATLSDFMRFSDALGETFYRLEEGPGHERVIGSERGRENALGLPTLFPVSRKTSTHALPLHGEMYYRKRRPPDLIWFFCARIGTSGGATWVCDGKALFRRFDDRLQNLLTARRLVYTRWHAAEVWPLIYGIDDLETMARYQRESDHELIVHADGSITTRFVADAVRIHQGEPCFINNLLPFALRELAEPEVRATVRFEDGERLSAADVYAMEAASLALKHELAWQSGDLAIIDNTRSMHGRGVLPAGLEREVYLRFSEAACCREWAPLPLALPAPNS